MYFTRSIPQGSSFHIQDRFVRTSCQTCDKSDRVSLASSLPPHEIFVISFSSLRFRLIARDYIFKANKHLPPANTSEAAAFEQSSGKLLEHQNIFMVNITSYSSCSLLLPSYICSVLLLVPSSSPSLPSFSSSSCCHCSMPPSCHGEHWIDKETRVSKTHGFKIHPPTLHKCLSMSYRFPTCMTNISNN